MGQYLICDVLRSGIRLVAYFFGIFCITQVPQNLYGSAQYLYGPPQVPANSYGMAQAPIQQVPPQHYGSVPYGSTPPTSHVPVQGQNNPARK